MTKIRQNWLVVSDNNPRLYTASFTRFKDALRWMYLELSAGSSVELKPGVDNRASDITLYYGNAPAELRRFVAQYGRRA